MADAIHQEIRLAAPGERVYAALTDSKQFAALTGGAPAEISADAGGSFTCFGGMVTGRNVELVPGQRIVQAWRVGNWPEGVYSIVRFELQPQSDGQTLLVMDQAGFPEEQRPHLDGGWHKMYWEPLRAFLR